MEFSQLASDDKFQLKWNSKVQQQKYKNPVSTNQDELRYVDWVIQKRKTHTGCDHSIIL